MVMVRAAGFEPATSRFVAGRSKSAELRAHLGGDGGPRTRDLPVKSRLLSHLSYVPTIHGSASRLRTRISRINSAPLYQLSYRGSGGGSRNRTGAWSASKADALPSWLSRYPGVRLGVTGGIRTRDGGVTTRSLRPLGDRHTEAHSVRVSLSVLSLLGGRSRTYDAPRFKRPLYQLSYAQPGKSRFGGEDFHGAASIAEMAGDEGFEPSSADLEAAMLPLHQSPAGASGRSRTHGLRFVRPALYQLSYARRMLERDKGVEPLPHGLEGRRTEPLNTSPAFGGPEGDRTLDLPLARRALSRLSYKAQRGADSITRSSRADSNRRPGPYKEPALTAELREPWWCRTGSNRRPSPYESAALPLSYGTARECILMARPEGFEPSTREVEARCSSPLSYGRMARRAGFEPAPSDFGVRRSSIELSAVENYALRRRLRGDIRVVVVRAVGFEPTSSSFRSWPSTGLTLRPERGGRGRIDIRARSIAHFFWRYQWRM